PMLRGRWARVAATCPATGKPIRLTVTPQGGIEDLDPPGAVVSLRLPDPDTSAGNAQDTICAYGHLFADREHASGWPALHPRPGLFVVADAARLAREIAAAARRYAETTTVCEAMPQGPRRRPPCARAKRQPHVNHPVVSALRLVMGDLIIS